MIVMKFPEQWKDVGIDMRDMLLPTERLPIPTNADMTKQMILQNKLHHRRTFVIPLGFLYRSLPCSLVLAGRVLTGVSHLVLQSLDKVVKANSSDSTSSGTCSVLAMCKYL